MKAPINTYISFKRVSRFPDNAAHIADGWLNTGGPFIVELDPNRGDLLVTIAHGPGDGVRVRVPVGTLVESIAAAERADAEVWEPLIQDTTNPELWGNTIISAAMREVEEGMIHVSYHRRDRAPIRDWRIGQRIKNELCGPDWEAVEIYPAESRVVDTSNEYHLWAVPWALPFGWNEADRMTQAMVDGETPGTKAVQRDDPTVSPADLNVESPRQSIRSPRMVTVPIGMIDILLRRLDALKEALNQQPERTPEIEFGFDQVLRAATKLAEGGRP